MSAKASIVIRCFNEEQNLGRLLNGIAQQTMRDVEILIVDSGSTDGTLAVARRYPVRILLISPEEFSFGRSLNMGCAAATSDLIVAASAHTYPVYDDWLEQLLRPFQNPQVALVYGRQSGDDGAKYAERQVFARWFPPDSNPHQTYPFCNNANAAIRRSLWLQFPYNEDLTGLEDLEWAKRMLERGYRLAYAADAEIVHVHRETWSQVFKRYQREAIAFKHIYPQERFGVWDFLRLVVSNVASDCRQAKRERVLLQHFSDIALFRLMQFWGTFRGFSHHGPVSTNLRQTFYYPGRTARVPPVAGPVRNGRRIDYERLVEKGPAS